MILAFAHPALVVDDLEKAREFYEQMFGFTVLSEEGWANSPAAERATGSVDSCCRGYYLKGHNCFLELFEFSAPASTAVAPGKLLPHEPGIRHLAFYVDDCRVEVARLLELGGSLLGQLPEVYESPCSVYCRDPFGNIIELCEVPHEREHPDKLPGACAARSG